MYLGTLPTIERKCPFATKAILATPAAVTMATDIQQYFCVTPPSVHQMVLTLERAGFIRRQPGAARSIEVLVDPKLLPELL